MTLKICSRGHQFEKSNECPTCPICWPGKYSKLKSAQKTKKQSFNKK